MTTDHNERNAELATPVASQCGHITQLSNVSGELYHDWRKLAEHTTWAAVDMHPDVMLVSDSSRVQPSGFIIHSGNQDLRVAQLAVLLEKTVRLSIVRGLPGQVRLRGLRLVGNGLLGVANTESMGLLIEACEKLINMSGGVYRCVLLEDVEVESPLWRAAYAASNLSVVVLAAPQTRLRLEFPANEDAYWAKFSSKSRYNMRRMKRLLDHEWTTVTQPGEVASFLAAVAEVSQQSWQGRRLGANKQIDEAHADCLCRLAKLGALRSYLLHSKGRPAAFAFGTQWNGRYILEEIGYDTRLAKFSPGTVLMLEMLDDLFAHNVPQVLDFGFGDSEYKRLLGTHSTESGSLLLVSRRLDVSMALGVRRAMTQLETIMRSAARRAGLNRRLRRLYRR